MLPCRTFQLLAVTTALTRLVLRQLSLNRLNRERHCASRVDCEMVSEPFGMHVVDSHPCKLYSANTYSCNGCIMFGKLCVACPKASVLLSCLSCAVLLPCFTGFQDFSGEFVFFP